MNRLLTLSAISILLLSTLAMDVAAAPLPGQSGCTTHQSANPRPAAWFTLGKPANYYDDACFHQYMVNDPSTANIDVAIVPPPGAFGLRDANLVRQSVQMWEDGLKAGARASGMSWLANGLEINPYVIGTDVPASASQAMPDIVVVLGDASPYLFGFAFAGVGSDSPVFFCHPLSASPADFPTADQVRAMPGFDGHHGNGWGTQDASCPNGDRVCYVVGAIVEDGLSQHHTNNFYDLNSHEFGHCLGLGHVGDASDVPASKSYPPEDIMSYEQDLYDPTYALCVSNLDLKTFAYRYRPLVTGAPATLPFGDDGTGHVTMEGGANPTPTNTAVQRPLPASSWRVFRNDGSTATSASACPQPDANLLPLPGEGGPDPGPNSTNPAVTIRTPADGDDIHVDTPVSVAGLVERDASTSSTSSSTSSTTTTTSSTTTSTGPPTDCAGAALLASDSATDSLNPAGGAFEALCLGASDDGTTFHFKARVADQAPPADLLYDDLYFTPSFGTMAGQEQLIEATYSSDGSISAFWDLGGTVPVAGTLLFPLYLGDPTRDVSVSLEGNTLDVSFPLAHFGIAPADGDTLDGVRLDVNHCEGTSCTITTDDLVPDAGGATYDFATGSAALAHLMPPVALPPTLPGVRGAQSAPMPAPATAPANAQVVDGAGDALSQQPQHDVRAAWFTEDASNLYVGLKVEDIPADTTTIAQTLFAVNFKPTYATTWSIVPAAGTFTGLRAFASMAPANTASPGSTQTQFKLQALWTEASGGKYGDLASLPASSLDIGTDILWWVIPKELLANGGAHPVAGDTLGTLGAGTGLNLVTATLNNVDVATSELTYTFTGGQQATERVEVYDGAVRVATAEGLDTTGGTDTAAWSTEVTLSGAGPHTLTARWLEADGTLIATDTVTVDATDGDPCDGAAAPVLSGLSWSAGSRFANVTWSTDVESSSLLHYLGGGREAFVNGTYGTTHRVNLAGLEPGTTYTYTVSSTACGLTSTSPENTFTTGTEGASITVDSPGDGATTSTPVFIVGGFDGDESQRFTSGTGATASVDAANALRNVVDSKSWRDAEAALKGLPGFVHAVPQADGQHATAYFAGDLPTGLAPKVEGWRIAYQGQAAPTLLRAPVTPEMAAGSVHYPLADALVRWAAVGAEPAGPAIPGVQDGIGPGSALLIGNYLCSASYLFQDPRDAEQYYLSTAGHCLLTAGHGVGKTGATTPSEVYGSVSVCFAGCIMNALAFGEYVDFTAAGSYHPVEYASASPTTTDADGIGRDFGLIKVPKAANGMLRGWMTQWGGPDGVSGTGVGDLLAIYGHGTHCCPVLGGVTTRTPADQGRLLVSLGENGDGSFSGIGHTTGGDSGAAIGVADLNDDKLVRADFALGVNTHGLVTSGVFDGTLLSKGIAMVDGQLGFAPVLVKAADAIVLPSSGGGGDGASVAFTSPADHATFDKAEVASVAVTGTATFPDAAGSPGTQSTTFFLHRKGCGTGQDNTLYMDTLMGTSDAGSGCASLLAPVGPAADALGLGLVDEFPADPAPAEPFAFDLTRPVHVDVRATGDVAPARALGDFEGELVLDGVVVAQKRAMTEVGGDFNVEMDLDWVAGAPTSVAAGSDLAFRFYTHQSAYVTYVEYGGEGGSRVSIPLAVPAVNKVQVSVDDASFTSGLLPVLGTTAWAADWGLGSVPTGVHTLYARLLQDGAPVGPVAAREVKVTETIVVPETYSVKLTLVREDLGTVPLSGANATVRLDNGSSDAGRWWYDWAPESAPAGTYTLVATLFLGDAQKAQATSHFVVPESTNTTSSTATSSSSSTTTTSPPAAPDLVSISPTRGSGSGGTLVTLTGSSFTLDAQVFFGGRAAASVSFVDESHLVATTPAGPSGARVDVTVRQAGGSDALPAAFHYTGPGVKSGATLFVGGEGADGAVAQPVDAVRLQGAERAQAKPAWSLPSTLLLLAGAAALVAVLAVRRKLD